MNNLPRQKLCELITQYGRSLCDDLQRCEALLRDSCGQYRGEITLLIGALKEGIASSLLSSQNSVPKVVLLERLIKRLHDNMFLSEDAARWAVESWAVALGVITPSETTTIDSSSKEQSRIPTQQVEETPSPKQATPVSSIPPTVVSPTYPLHQQTTYQSSQPQAPSMRQEGWQKPAIIGSLIGASVLVGLLLTRSPTPPLVDRPSTSNGASTQPQVQIHRVHFAEGSTGTILQGSLVAKQLQRYLLKCGEGQSMTVWLQSGRVEVKIVAPGDQTIGTVPSNTSQWQGQLPKDGDYAIEVYGSDESSYSIAVNVL
ncbi:MAG TPA: hypothetical protein V6C85_30120 [Allocoleopsis sp.]